MKSIREIERRVRRPFYLYAGGGLALYVLSWGIESPVWIWVPIVYFFICAAGYPYLLVFNALMPLGPERVYSGPITRMYVRQEYLWSEHSTTPCYYFVIQEREAGELKFEVDWATYDLRKVGDSFSIPMRRGALGIPFRWNVLGIL